MPRYRYMLVSPPLPPSIRLLDKLFGTAGHASIAPYTPEAAAAAREAGQRVAVVGVNSGELNVANLPTLDSRAPSFLFHSNLPNI